MKRFSPAPFAILAALAAFVVDAAPVRAEARQVVFDSASLQGYLNGLSESINVDNQQVEDAQRWKSTISSNSAVTLMIELASDAAGNSLGVYSAGDDVPTLYEIFPASATAGQFAMAAFRSSPNRLVVTLFAEDGTPLGTETRLGVDPHYFGYYIKNAAAEVGYSEDFRNNDFARMLAYKGTGRNLGNWWLCFEDNVPDNSTVLPSDRDFDDAILFVESINPNPTSTTRATWGALKSRFR